MSRKVVRMGLALLILIPLLTYLNWRRKIGSEFSTPSRDHEVKLGLNASLGGHQLFPPDHPWNTRIDHASKDSMSDAFISIIGEDTPLHPDFGSGRFGYHLYGIPYMVVDGNSTKKYRLPFLYEDQSDDVFYPIPENPVIEDGLDKHLLILDRRSGRLYEIFALERDGTG